MCQWCDTYSVAECECWKEVEQSSFLTVAKGICSLLFDAMKVEARIEAYFHRLCKHHRCNINCRVQFEFEMATSTSFKFKSESCLLQAQAGWYIIIGVSLANTQASSQNCQEIAKI